jgi:hypothetical protein
MPNEKVSEQETQASTRGVRGISYPAISLDEAISRAQQFWAAEKKNAAPVAAAGQHWGYTAKSSATRLVVAALLHYGLLEDLGSGDDRQVKLTDRALDILLDAPESPKRLKALQEAAMAPKINADIFSRWSPSELPSDQTLRFFLLRERNFNESSVDGFITDLRKTVGVAKLELTGEISTKPDSSAEARIEDPSIKLDAQSQTKLGGAASFTQGPMRQDVFSLDEGSVVLQWPANMSAASYEDFESWIQLQMRKIKRSIQATSSDTQGQN